MSTHGPAAGPPEGAAAGATLAAKIDRLFRTLHPRGRGEYSYAEVAEEIRRRGGPTISGAYLCQLRLGVRDNPTKRHLEALAEFFGVPPGYFFDGQVAARVEAELELLGALRDASVRQMAVRAFGLSPESLATITELIERVRHLEGLADPPEAPRRSDAPTEPAVGRPEPESDTRTRGRAAPADPGEE